jgi:hypothetical protein
VNEIYELASLKAAMPTDPHRRSYYDRADAIATAAHAYGVITDDERFDMACALLCNDPDRVLEALGLEPVNEEEQC